MGANLTTNFSEWLFSLAVSPVIIFYMFLGFDPGKDKCGLAIMTSDGQIKYHEIIASEKAIAQINKLCQKYPIQTLIMGNQTTSKTWKQQLENSLTSDISLVMVDEKNSTLEARDRYWQMYPPQWLQRLIPQGMRTPPRPVDDIVAIILIERYLP
jgi:RNase H-fold protein (predicted Holliday junction resolvase)